MTLAGTLTAPTPTGQHRVPRSGTRRRPPTPRRQPEARSQPEVRRPEVRSQPEVRRPPDPGRPPTGPGRPGPRNQRRAPREPQRTMQLLMSALGAVIMLSICGLGAFFIVADERRGHDAEAAAMPQAPARDISSRAVDGRPLTTKEVFPSTAIEIVPGAAPYEIQMTHVDTDCQVATTGRLGRLLNAYGCDQFVRATMASSSDGYLVTAGIFNLADEAGAKAVHEKIKPLVDNGTGTFAGMAAGPGTAPVELPSAQVGWHVRGHFLLYCVIARPDGQIIADDDPYAQRIIYDMIETYLRDGVVGRRAAPLNPTVPLSR